MGEGRHHGKGTGRGRQILSSAPGYSADMVLARLSDRQGPKRGNQTGPNPTDRGKSGVKRHVMTDERGVPISVQPSSASQHDAKSALHTIDSAVTRKNCPQMRPSNFCLDKGYDPHKLKAAILRRRIIPHIRRRGEPLLACHRGKPRRWVVKRTHSWHNRYRGLLIRWERHGRNYLALVPPASAMIAIRSSLVF